MIQWLVDDQLSGLLKRSVANLFIRMPFKVTPKIMKKSSQLKFLALAFTTPFAASAATLFSDNFATDTLTSYTRDGGAHTWSATAGIGGGGGIVISQTANNSSTFIPTATSFTFAAGAANQITVSMMLKLNSSGFGGGTSKAFFGIADATNYSWGQNAPTGVSAIGGGLQNAAQTITRSAVTGGTSFNGNNSGNLTLTNGNWYQLSAVLTKPASGGIWTADLTLADYDTNGLTFMGEDVFTGLSVNMGASSISATSAVNFAVFGVRDQSWSAMDNLSVTAIPEPSSYAALVGLGALGFIALRRRRNGKA